MFQRISSSLKHDLFTSGNRNMIIYDAGVVTNDVGISYHATWVIGPKGGI